MHLLQEHLQLSATCLKQQCAPLHAQGTYIIHLVLQGATRTAVLAVGNKHCRTGMTRQHPAQSRYNQTGQLLC